MTIFDILIGIVTMWKVTKYSVFSGPYFPVFGLNAGKCRPEKTPYLDTFHAVSCKMVAKSRTTWYHCLPTPNWYSDNCWIRKYYQKWMTSVDSWVIRTDRIGCRCFEGLFRIYLWWRTVKKLFWNSTFSLSGMCDIHELNAEPKWRFLWK